MFLGEIRWFLTWHCVQVLQIEEEIHEVSVNRHRGHLIRRNFQLNWFFSLENLEFKVKPYLNLTIADIFLC